MKPSSIAQITHLIFECPIKWDVFVIIFENCSQRHPYSQQVLMDEARSFTPKQLTVKKGENYSTIAVSTRLKVLLHTNFLPTFSSSSHSLVFNNRPQTSQTKNPQHDNCLYDLRSHNPIMDTLNYASKLALYISFNDPRVTYIYIYIYSTRLAYKRVKNQSAFVGMVLKKTSVTPSWRTWLHLQYELWERKNLKSGWLTCKSRSQLSAARNRELTFWDSWTPSEVQTETLNL